MIQDPVERNLYLNKDCPTGKASDSSLDMAWTAMAWLSIVLFSAICCSFFPKVKLGRPKSGDGVQTSSETAQRVPGWNNLALEAETKGDVWCLQGMVYSFMFPISCVETCFYAQLPTGTAYHSDLQGFPMHPHHELAPRPHQFMATVSGRGCCRLHVSCTTGPLRLCFSVEGLGEKNAASEIKWSKKVKLRVSVGQVSCQSLPIRSINSWIPTSVAAGSLAAASREGAFQRVFW